MILETSSKKSKSSKKKIKELEAALERERQNKQIQVTFLVKKLAQQQLATKTAVKSAHEAEQKLEEVTKETSQQIETWKTKITEMEEQMQMLRISKAELGAKVEAAELHKKGEPIEQIQAKFDQAKEDILKELEEVKQVCF